MAMDNYLNRKSIVTKQYPEKILQFGEGNFLRAFIDWMIDQLNEKTDFNSGITLVRPINSVHPSINKQDGLYTAITRGINEKQQRVADIRLINSVNREILIYSEYDKFIKCAENPELEWIFSNTTEAGIVYNPEIRLEEVPAKSFPGKLTQFLFHRFQYFNGDQEKGLFIIPCELIDYNGEKLKEFVIKYAQDWSLPNEFITWLNECNTFCSTLVDRIVTGYPKNEIEKLESKLGYKDEFLVTAEHFYLFVIQGPKILEEKLKLNSLPLNIKIVDDIKPYKERKVAILNGAHTSMVPVAYLAGIKTVREVTSNPIFLAYIKELITQEVIPVLSQDASELNQFAKDVINRFNNPYIEHELLSISLNSLTKFKTRLLPQLLSYAQQNNNIPYCISFSLAALIVFYRGKFNHLSIPLKDDEYLLERFKAWDRLYDTDITQLTYNVLAMTDLWGIDLNQIDSLAENIALKITQILNSGTQAILEDRYSK
ncbi:tagaturonate reductase [Providencia rettgeri]|uniref:tagaturonate reductase n=1 Tax=Providencia rettgeri TaxID=587 RepID=UPI0034E07E45